MRLRLREEELVARSVEVDAERELLDPLEYGEDRDSERDAWARLLAETVGVRRRSSPAGRDTLRGGAGDPCVLACVETARRLSYFDAMRGCGSVGVTPGMFCVCPASEAGMEIRADNWADYRGMDSPFLDLVTGPFFGFCYAGLLRP